MAIATAAALTELEWLTSPVLERLFEKSISLLGSDYGKDLEDLDTSLLPQIQRTIQAPQYSPHKAQLARWFKRLKEAYYDAECVLDEVVYERLSRKVERKIVGKDRKLSVRVSSKPIIKPLAKFAHPAVKRSSLLSPLKKKLLDRLKKLKEIAAEAKTFHDLLGMQNTESNDAILTGNSSSVTSSFLIDKVFGRDGDRDEIINFLLDKQGGSSLNNSYSVVAVTGIGGVGKTTLVQYVYNDERVKNHFGVRMWLCLSQNFDTNDLIKEMIECASEKECPNLSSLDVLQDKLIETLPKSEKIMVVLDDVWYDNNDKEVGENKWNNLLKPLKTFASRGETCKIVVTSRSASFPFALLPGKLIELSDLTPNDSISLLRYHAIDGLQINDPQLKNDLSDIVDHLRLSVPLAPLVAKVVGNQLRERPDVEFWQATLGNVNLSTDDEIAGNSRSITSSLLSDKVFGQDGDCAEIIHFLLDEEGNRDEIINFLLDKQGGSSLTRGYSVVAVTGIRGVGKTRLVQFVYNDERVKEHFDLRMWVCISQKFDITALTKEMIECASGEECPNLISLGVLQDKLIETLSKSDKIMVVLVDVWYDNNHEEVRENEWNHLLKPLIEFASRGGTCKFVVTSRSTSFPFKLLPDKLIKLSNLAPDDLMLIYRDFQICSPQLENDLSNIVEQNVEKTSKSPMEQQPFQTIAARYQLNFINEVRNPTFTTSLVGDVNGNPIKVAIYDTFSQSITSPDCFLSSATVRLFVLNAELWEERRGNWSRSEINESVLRERKGKPILEGCNFIRLENGLGVFQNIYFNDNSRWTKSGFRLGVMVVGEGEEGYLNGERILEGVSKCFRVIDHRGKALYKPELLELKHGVHCLKKIGKYRASLLQNNNINTVEDFLKLYYNDESALHKILGIQSKSDKGWKCMVEHAMQCAIEFDAKYNDFNMSSQCLQHELVLELPTMINEKTKQKAIEAVPCIDDLLLLEEERNQYTTQTFDLLMQGSGDGNPPYPMFGVEEDNEDFLDL